MLCSHYPPTPFVGRLSGSDLWDAPRTVMCHVPASGHGCIGTCLHTPVATRLSHLPSRQWPGKQSSYTFRLAMSTTEKRPIPFCLRRDESVPPLRFHVASSLLPNKHEGICLQITVGWCLQIPGLSHHAIDALCHTDLRRYLIN